MHSIQARLAGHSPWGWRDGVIEAWDDGTVRIRYVHEAAKDTHKAELFAACRGGTPDPRRAFRMSRRTLVHTFA